MKAAVTELSITVRLGLNLWPGNVEEGEGGTRFFIKRQPWVNTWHTTVSPLSFLDKTFEFL